MILLTLLCLVLCFRCNKTNENPNNNDDLPILEKDNITDGHFVGHFVLDNRNYWCNIEISNKKYEEWPSGGMLYQKDMGCLTIGSFNIIEDVISFTLDSYKFPTFPCDTRTPLPGEYKIHLLTLDDSLVFSKGTGSNKIIYHLKNLDLK